MAVSTENDRQILLYATLTPLCTQSPKNQRLITSENGIQPSCTLTATKLKPIPLLLSPPTYTVALLTHCTTPSNVSMTKQDAGEEFLSGLSADDNLDNDSDFELDAIIHSGY